MIKIDREKSLAELTKAKQIMLESETILDSDGYICDEGAAEYYGQLSEMISALKNDTDLECLALSEQLGIELY